MAKYGTTRVLSKVLADFRSDTVTKPTKKMLEAMCASPVGDDVYEEDPTVIELEKKVANLCGHEAALFCTTGTLSNQLAIRTHLRPLDSVIADSRSHIAIHETGGVAFHSRAMLYSITPTSSSGHITASQVREAIIEPGDVHETPTRLVCLENTLNGMVLPLQNIKEIREVVDEHKLVMHLDGARLWNASISTGIPFKEYGKYFDSISLCISKGLGAPIGSVLTGSNEFIRKARHFRKLFGSGWRQAGVLAGACIYAIDNHWPLMKEDHLKAQLLSQRMTSLGFNLVYPTETNMVWLTPSPSITFKLQEWEKELKSHGIIISTSKNICRLVVHIQISQSNIEDLIKITEDFITKQKNQHSKL